MSLVSSHRLTGRLGLALILAPLVAVTCLALAAETPPRKALVLGAGDPQRDPDGGRTHPQMAKENFLRLVGNPQNDPAKGWTADLSWDLMVRLGMNPTNTPVETLFNYIGQHRLGYRIVIQNSAGGASAPFWGCAVDNGMMPFAPQGDNRAGIRIEDSIGLKPAVAVAGGVDVNFKTYGPSMEFFEAMPNGDAAQSWANQAVAAKFARILDAHPDYNIWDARQHLRQSASLYPSGWAEDGGYGRPPNQPARIAALDPAPPLDIQTVLSDDGTSVTLSWQNFLQSSFAETVIQRADGRVIYHGTGTNFIWPSDRNGEETFHFSSKDQSGRLSGPEAYTVQ